MAESRKESTKKSDGKPEYLSVRLYTPDAEKLAKLKALKNDESVAVTFRMLFGKLLDNALAKAARGTAEEMERGE